MALSKEMQKLMETPIEELIVRTRAKTADFGVLSDEEKAVLHRKVAVNIQIAKKFNAGAETAQFFLINDTPMEDAVSVVYAKGDKVSFTKEGQLLTLPILSFNQKGSRLKVSYKIDGKELKFTPAGMSIKTEKGNVALGRATLVKKDK